MYRRSENEMNELRGVMILIILLIGSLATDCHSAPLVNQRLTWREQEGDPTIFTSSCDPITGRCLEWLPIVDSHLHDYIVQPDLDYNRVQLIQTRNVDRVSEPWKDPSPDDSNIGSFGPQLVGTRLTKKDVFMSRGWGAGGMPFSVLYMSPRANHPTPLAQVESAKIVEPVRKTSELPNPRVNQPSNRVALRNGGSGPLRRHYSIIPQLFISYGWGPSGK